MLMIRWAKPVPVWFVTNEVALADWGSPNPAAEPEPKIFVYYTPVIPLISGNPVSQYGSSEKYRG